MEPQRAFSYLLALMTLFSAPCKTQSNESNVIHVTGLFPLSDDVHEGGIGRGVLPAVKLALQHVKDSDQVLNGYELTTIYNDTVVSRTL